MFSIIVTIIIIYLLTRFIFGFVIPVVIASNKMKKKMREMEGFNADKNFRDRQHSQSPPNPQRPAKSDYIDYEEVK